MFGGRITLFLSGAIMILLIVIALQADVLSKRADRIDQLETDLAGLIRGIALTESLIKANGDLDKLQAEIGDDLVDAPDYDVLLSDDIIGAAERLRTGAQRSLGPVR